VLFAVEVLVSFKIIGDEVEEVGVDALMKRDGRILMVRDCVFRKVNGLTGTLRAESDKDACVSLAGCALGSGGGTDNKLLLLLLLLVVLLPS
jgi:hypothetical protein